MLHSFGISVDNSIQLSWKLSDGVHGGFSANLLLGNAGLCHSPFGVTLSLFKSGLLAWAVGKEYELDHSMLGSMRYCAFMRVVLEGVEHEVKLHVEAERVVKVEIQLHVEGKCVASCAEVSQVPELLEWVSKWEITKGSFGEFKRSDFFPCLDAAVLENMVHKGNLLHLIRHFDSISVGEEGLEVHFKHEGVKWASSLDALDIGDFGILRAQYVASRLFLGACTLFYWGDFTRFLPMRVHRNVTGFLLRVLNGRDDVQALFESDSEKVLLDFPVQSTFIMTKEQEVARYMPSVHSAYVGVYTGHDPFC